ncbi:hypothetical protein CMI42_00240 [Candidatus Pacearchaeota archaeon]|nr:hypothetical protein [Candidatus Pacearchaeota archaeon]|tara:strand:+ start:2223 stop:2495 length:273 start_codon:yes stop_codon:yes gene_type:complete
MSYDIQPQSRIESYRSDQLPSRGAYREPLLPTNHTGHDYLSNSTTNSPHSAYPSIKENRGSYGEMPREETGNMILRKFQQLSTRSPILNN